MRFFIWLKNKVNSLIDMRFDFRPFCSIKIALLLTFLVLSGCGGKSNRDKNQLPNIILIYLDDVGYSDFGCYGGDSIQTSRLDRMAEEGIMFTDFYAATAMCTPSRAAILTGCYPKRIGMSYFTNQINHVLLPGGSEGINPDEMTIPEMLKEKGYVTKMVGKWHLGDQLEFLPLQHGFDSFFGLPYSHDIHPDHERNDLFNFPPLPLIRDNEVIESNPDRKLLSERFTEEAVEFISNNKQKPFFLYYAHIQAHWPLIPPDEFLKKSENDPYRACIEYIDYSTGEILDALKEAKIEENTLIICTSDNGTPPRPLGGYNTPLRGYKGQIWEGGVRIPCIMRWPVKIPEGLVCSELATQMDFLPTLATITGSELPSERIFDGKDITSLIFGEEDAKSQYEAFYYYFMNDLSAVRSGPWKLVVNEPFNTDFTGPQLYNLNEDIGETNDKADDHPQIVADLEALAESARNDLGDDLTERTGVNCRPPGKVDHPTLMIPHDH
jgi:arylsulfatase A